MYDFPDFYCAGEALDAAKNPYTYEPLRTCEHRVGTNPSFASNPSLAVPAPQPPYDFPFFMALAKAGFSNARAIYAAGIVAAVLASALILWRSGVPLDVALLALALAPGYQELAAGQIVPFALLFLVLTGWMLVRRRDALAGVFAGLTAVEPHLGIAVALAVLLFVRGARWSVIGTCAALAALGLTVTRVPGFVSYFTAVLPAQAWAEVRFPPQYSLTYLLHVAGVPDALALQLGAVSFLLLLIAGLGMAPKISAQVQRRDLLVYFPAATTVIAGAYVHVIELCFAIPAALIFACFSQGLRRSIAASAVSLLTVPWIAAWGVKKLFLAAVFVTAALLYRLRVIPAVAVGVTALIAATLYLFELHPPWLPTAPSLAATSYASQALVQTEWRSVAQSLDAHDPFWLAIKLPGWCGLAAIFILGLSEYRSG